MSDLIIVNGDGQGEFLQNDQTPYKGQSRNYKKTPTFGQNGWSQTCPLFGGSTVIMIDATGNVIGLTLTTPVVVTGMDCEDADEVRILCK